MEPQVLSIAPDNTLEMTVDSEGKRMVQQTQYVISDNEQVLVLTDGQGNENIIQLQHVQTPEAAAAEETRKRKMDELERENTILRRRVQDLEEFVTGFKIREQMRLRPGMTEQTGQSMDGVEEEGEIVMDGDQTYHVVVVNPDGGEEITMSSPKKTTTNTADLLELGLTPENLIENGMLEALPDGKEHDFIIQQKLGQMRKRPYKCKHCAESFVSKKELSIHMLGHVGEEALACQICNKKFALDVYLQKHMIAHGTERPFHCRICNRGFARKGDMAAHEMRHTKPRCPKCRQRFTNSESMALHMALCDITFACKRCDLVFNARRELTAHQATHQEERFVCTVCSTVFTRYQSLQQHLRVHSKIHSCTTCGQKFAQATLLRLHMKEHKPPRMYCELCTKSFPTRSKLLRHMQSHANKVQCEMCKHFLNEDDLEAHMEKHMGRKCEECSESFPSKAELQAHVDSAHPKEYACTTCERSFNTLNALNSHKGRCKHTRAKPLLNCSQCTRLFENSEDLQNHFIECHEKQFSCPRPGCDRSFSTQNAVNSHSGQAHPGGVEKGERDSEDEDQHTVFICEECDMIFASLQLLINHRRVHKQGQPSEASQDIPKGEISIEVEATGEDDESNLPMEMDESFPCSRCEEGFVTDKAVTRHMNKRHPFGNREKRRIRCKTCGMYFPNVSVSESHALKKHPASTMKYCAYCGKNIDNPEEMAKHILSHSMSKVSTTEQAEGVHVCAICHREFRSESGLEEHKKIPHVNGMPYPCTECDKGFKFLRNLTEHMGLHERGHNLSCEECGMTFKSLSSLTVHMHRHAGIKRFPCDVCEKSFTTSTELKRHEFVHTNTRPFICMQCGRGFTQSKRLEIHLIKDHIK